MVSDLLHLPLLDAFASVYLSSSAWFAPCSPQLSTVRNYLLQTEATRDVSTIYSSRFCKTSSRVDIGYHRKPEEHFPLCVDEKGWLELVPTVLSEPNLCLFQDTETFRTDPDLAASVMRTNILVKDKINIVNWTFTPVLF